MSWIEKAYDRIWRVTKGNRGANEHVSVNSGVVFLEDEDRGEVLIGLISNGAPKPFRFARLQWDAADKKLRGPVRSRGGTTYQLEVSRDTDCTEEMIREGICGTVGKRVLRFDIEANPSVGAQGAGSGGGTWHAED